MRIYIDSSFLVSLYSPDANSVPAVHTMQTSSGDRLLTTLAELEFLNALQLRVFRQELLSGGAKSAAEAFEDDLRKRVFQSVSLPEQTFEHARLLSERTTARLGTRTADLVHVAAAMELQAETMFSFDHRLRRLAQTLKLKLN